MPELGDDSMVALVRLLCVAGPDAGQRYHLDPNGATIGRDRSASVRLQDLDVSRRHAHILMRREMLVLEDLGSRNGTLINGTPATCRALRSGDQIQVGTTVLVLVLL